jgi:hypothetical protein
VRAITGQGEHGPVVSAAVVASALLVLILTIPAGLPVVPVALLVAFIAVAVVAYRSLLSWRGLLAATILVILFVPTKRYELPGNLPFDLEPYRVAVAFVTAGWISSLLIDPRVRLRKTGLEAPFVALFAAVLASDVVNAGEISAGGWTSDVVKELMFFASFVLIVYLVVGVARTAGTIAFLVEILVGGTAVVAFFALVEARTGFNVFDRAASSIPFLSPTGDVVADVRDGTSRVVASAQTPIPLGAALVLVLPLAIHLARTAGRWRIAWWAAVGVIFFASLATVSRTAVVMLGTLAVALFFLRRDAVKRLWPLVIPLVVAAPLAVPGAVGTLKASFFPPGGLLAEQNQHAGWSGSGRIADLGPAMAVFARRPVLGEGYATREPGRPGERGQILDDQWLKTLLETGVVGTFALLWLFFRMIRIAGRTAKEDDGELGSLLTAVAASVSAFAVGMFLYDAFSFVQVTFVFYLLVGLGAAALSVGRSERPA